MLRNVFLRTIADARRALAWWSLGLAGLVALMVSVYPTVRDNPSLNKLVEDYPEALKGFVAFGGDVDYASAAGYLGTELFAFIVPLLLLIAAIGAGARAIAGEEEAGTLDLLLANPLSRRRLLLEKAAAIIAETAVLGLVILLALVAGVLAELPGRRARRRQGRLAFLPLRRLRPAAARSRARPRGTARSIARAPRLRRDDYVRPPRRHKLTVSSCVHGRVSFPRCSRLCRIRQSRRPWIPTWQEVWR